MAYLKNSRLAFLCAILFASVSACQPSCKPVDPLRLDVAGTLYQLEGQLDAFVDSDVIDKLPSSSVTTGGRFCVRGGLAVPHAKLLAFSKDRLANVSGQFAELRQVAQIALQETSSQIAPRSGEPRPESDGLLRYGDGDRYGLYADQLVDWPHPITADCTKEASKTFAQGFCRVRSAISPNAQIVLDVNMQQAPPSTWGKAFVLANEFFESLRI